MKSKEKKTLVAMSPKELMNVLKDAQTALSLLVINRYGKPPKNARESRTLRSKIAIISTLMRQKELAHE